MDKHRASALPEERPMTSNLPAIRDEIAIDVAVLRDVVTLARECHYVTVRERDSLADVERALTAYDESIRAAEFGRLIDARA